MPLSKNEASIGLSVQRIKGEGEQKVDIGRVGTIMPPTEYNLASGSIRVKYDPTDLFPIKEDDCCTYFEFEKLELKEEIHA